MGKGCYRTDINIGNIDGRRFELLFDGAMSEAQVFVNGEKVCEWPYGYNAFHCDITRAVTGLPFFLKTGLSPLAGIPAPGCTARCV